MHGAPPHLPVQESSRRWPGSTAMNRIQQCLAVQYTHRCGGVAAVGLAVHPEHELAAQRVLSLALHELLCGCRAGEGWVSRRNR